MKIQSLKLVCFSPTGTTKAIIQGVARGIHQRSVELIDITKPQARKQPLQTLEDELLVVAVPVYVGRVPALVNEWLHTIEARHSPTVCIVVYGNRDYDDALLELKDTLIKRGCIPIACAAYIGEHSFSNSETPIAVARPDACDLHHAELFGRKIAEKLMSISSSDLISDIHVPGSYPYRGATKTWVVDFIAVSDQCSQCGVCAEVCPVGAVDLENSTVIDKEKCILCCACIKRCPQKAKTVKPGLVKDAAVRVSERFKERKEPVFFF
jgi:ferredoxin